MHHTIYLLFSYLSISSPPSERGTEEVTFLYKLSSGSSPRSYGINVARLAGLPQAVIELALRQSRAFEDRMLSAQAAQGGGTVATGGAGECVFCVVT